MKPLIAIPVPHSQKPAYAQQSLQQYIHAIEASGGEAVVIQLDQNSSQLAKEISRCDAVLLPGSSADVDPQKYNAEKEPQTAEPDGLRDAADELLLQDAHNMRKPIFGICYGLQSLNVWRSGSLIQDIPSQIKTSVNHSAGRAIACAHTALIDPLSNLASILRSDAEAAALGKRISELDSLELEVNSSHHQSADCVGDGLRIAARCPVDGVVEAVEGTYPGHFVLGVQWHPERGYEEDAASRALFKAFIQAAAGPRA